VTFSLLDIALENAHELLGSKKAKFRLSNIDVEEVSFVDRAANQRTFLVVKRDSRDPGAENVSVDKSTVDKLLPSSLRSRAKTATKKSEDKDMSKFVESIAKSLEQLTAFAKALKDRQDDDKTEELSDELKSELSSISSEIVKLYVEHGMAKASDAVIQAVEGLVQVSEMSLLLAEDIAVSGEISEETNTQMSKISTLIGSITKAEESEEADSASAEGDADSDSEEESNEDTSTEDETTDESEGSGDETGDESSEESGESDETAKNDDPSELDKLVACVGQLAATVTNLVTLETTKAAEAKKSETEETEESEDDETSSLKKQVEDLKIEKAALKTKLKKATEEPPERGSSSRGIKGEGKKTITLFPEDYNAEPVYDPGAAAS